MPPTLAEASGIPHLTLAEAEALQPLWVDARSRDAFEAVHIPSALHLNMAEWDSGAFAAFAAAWSPQRPVVVYCDGGGCQSSIEIAKRLHSAIPQIRVHILQGGFPVWQSR